MPGRAGRAHRRHHLPEQLIGQLRLIPVAGQARRLPRPDIPRGGLHIHARPPGRRALARPGQPRPQDLSHLCHQNLPERHPLPSLPVRNEPEEPSRVVHQLATQVVPSPWQQPSAGGPMLMAGRGLACREQRGTIRIRRAQRAARASLPRLFVLRIWFVTQRGIGRICFVRSPRFTLAHRRHLAAVSGPRSRMRTSCWAGQTFLAHTLGGFIVP